MAAARAPPHPGRVRARSKASDARPGAPWPRMAPASADCPLHPSPPAFRSMRPGRSLFGLSRICRIVLRRVFFSGSGWFFPGNFWFHHFIVVYVGVGVVVDGRPAVLTTLAVWVMAIILLRKRIKMIPSPNKLNYLIKYKLALLWWWGGGTKKRILYFLLNLKRSSVFRWV